MILRTTFNIACLKIWNYLKRISKATDKKALNTNLNQVTAIKEMKVTLVLDPCEFPKKNARGKELTLNFAIPNTSIRLTAKMNPKNYRKAVKALEVHNNNVALNLRAKITKSLSILEEGSLAAQPNIVKNKAKETAE